MAGQVFFYFYNVELRLELQWWMGSYYGLVGEGWEVVEKDISTQVRNYRKTLLAKNTNKPCTFQVRGIGD